MTALVWGVKASLIDYIRSLPDGSVEMSDGAVATGAGFRFAQSERGGLRFTGTVTLTAHNGMLHIVIADPELQPDGAGLLLTIADPDDPTLRLPFGQAAGMQATTEGDRCTGTTLTEDGADLFFGPYEAGTPLDDPLVLR